MNSDSLTFTSRISGFFRELRSRLSRAFSYLSSRPILSCFLLSFLLTFLNEILSRRSLLSAFRFLFTRPLLFLCNFSVILILESLALLFRKRRYMTVLFSLLILIFGLTDFIIGFFRQTPFSSMDFVLLSSVLPILPVYLTPIGTAFALLALLSLAIFLIFRWKKSKKNPLSLKRSSLTLLLSSLLSFLFIGSSYLFGLIPHHFSNLIDAYDDYGFSFCFAAGIFDRGVDKPSGYGQGGVQEVVSDVLGRLPDDSETDSGLFVPSDTSSPSPSDPSSTYPNIIFVQLESFFDLNLLSGFSFSEDPVPVFSELKENFSHGLLTVPSIGAGTVNTEFEVLTGMCIGHFGAGEVPYQTVLQDTTCESLCYNLKSLGYTSHAVHNYKANFYDRLNVFPHLGFNTFTSLEYMSGYSVNRLGWAEDKILNDCVLSSLQSTPGPDLVYCITVQCHGAYPTSDDPTSDSHLKILSLPEKANLSSFTYYANQLHQTDEFIGALLSSVSSLDEDTIVVLFGDHLPNIGIKEDWLPSGSTLYDTEYVIWCNRGKIGKSQDLHSYQLSSEILSLIGCREGVLNVLHQSMKGQPNYDAYLQMLEYDVLYGDRFVYGGVNPYSPTTLHLGIGDITISEVRSIGESTYVTGQNFTESSRVFVNGLIRSTEFVDRHTLVLPKYRVDSGDVVKVVQISDFIISVGETDDYIVP